MAQPVNTLPTGIDEVALRKVLQNWVVAGSGLPAEKVVWGEQTKMPRPTAPAIVLRLSNNAEMSKGWVDTQDNPYTFAPLTVNSVDTSADTLPVAAHGLLTGDGPVHLASTILLPTPLLANTDYWVIAPDANTLQIAASYADTGGGQGAGNPTTAIDLTDAGSGTITISPTADTLRAGQEIMEIARSYERVTLEMRCHASEAVTISAASAILRRVRTRSKLTAQQDALRAARIGLLFVERIRAILGVQDALLFEPRAQCDIQFCVPNEEGAYKTIITSASGTVTSTSTGRTFPFQSG